MIFLVFVWTVASLALCYSFVILVICWVIIWMMMMIYEERLRTYLFVLTDLVCLNWTGLIDWLIDMHAYNGVLTILGFCVLCFCKGQTYCFIIMCMCAFCLKRPSLKWPIRCRVGRLTVLTHLFLIIGKNRRYYHSRLGCFAFEFYNVFVFVNRRVTLRQYILVLNFRANLHKMI